MKGALQKYVNNFLYVVCINWNFCVQITAAKNFFSKKTPVSVVIHCDDNIIKHG